MRLLFPGRLVLLDLPPLPPAPFRLPKSNFSVLSRVFCFDLRPLPPNPNFESLPFREIFGRSSFERFEGLSEIASSTATSKASSFVWGSFRTSFRSKGAKKLRSCRQSRDTQDTHSVSGLSIDPPSPSCSAPAPSAFRFALAFRTSCLPAPSASVRSFL